MIDLPLTLSSTLPSLRLQESNMLLILLIVLIVLALSGPWYPYSRNWGYGPSGLLGVVLLILLIYLLLGNRL